MKVAFVEPKWLTSGVGSNLGEQLIANLCRFQAKSPVYYAFLYFTLAQTGLSYAAVAGSLSSQSANVQMNTLNATLAKFAGVTASAFFTKCWWHTRRIDFYHRILIQGVRKSRRS